MPEFSVDGVSYRLRPLAAVDEWRLFVLYQPLLGVVAGLEQGIRAGTTGGQSLSATLHPLLQTDDDNLTALISACRDACEQDVDGTWRAVDADLPMQSLITFIMEACGAALGAFFTMKRTAFQPMTRDGASFESVRMEDGEEWFWRPVMRRMCLAESMYDGTLNLARVAKLNDVADVHDENEYRARKATEREAERARPR